MSYRYRDTRTKRFVSRDTWKRSKSRGGKRYKRESTRRRKHPRYANMLVSMAYVSRTPDNGYRVEILIQRKKKESNSHIFKRIANLFRRGYFDSWASEFNMADFQWMTFFNREEILGVTPGKHRAAAELLSFERI